MSNDLLLVQAVIPMLSRPMTDLLWSLSSDLLLKLLVCSFYINFNLESVKTLLISNQNIIELWLLSLRVNLIRNILVFLIQKVS